MRVLTNISTLLDLQMYVDYLRTLSPEKSDDKEYLLIKEFMRFSPEKFAREIGKNEIHFSKTINNIKGELNKKIKHVIRIEKMNSVLPSVGSYSFLNSHVGARVVKSTQVYRFHCICVKDTIMGLYHYRLKFFRGVIYSYFVHDGKYYVIHRDNPGDQLLANYRSHNSECGSVEFFQSHFVNLRDWRIDQIIYSNSELGGPSD